MSAQLVLFDPLEAKFLDFHHANPEVYTALVDLARRWKRAGNTKVGIAMLFEVLRWERGLAGIKDDDGWKLNNSYRSRYARIIMANEKDLVGFFDVRTLHDRSDW